MGEFVVGMSECYMLCSISVSGRSIGLPETGFLWGASKKSAWGRKECEEFLLYL